MGSKRNLDGACWIQGSFSGIIFHVNESFGKDVTHPICGTNKKFSSPTLVGRSENRSITEEAQRLICTRLLDVVEEKMVSLLKPKRGIQSAQNVKTLRWKTYWYLFMLKKSYQYHTKEGNILFQLCTNSIRLESTSNIYNCNIYFENHNQAYYCSIDIKESKFRSWFNSSLNMLELYLSQLNFILEFIRVFISAVASFCVLAFYRPRGWQYVRLASNNNGSTWQSIRRGSLCNHHTLPSGLSI